MDLDVRPVTGGPLDVNAYVVGAKGADACILIDPGVPVEDVAAAVGQRHVDAVLLTHAHFDHMLYAEPWLARSARLYVHQLDAPYLSDPLLNLCGIAHLTLTLPAANVLLKDGDVVHEAGMDLSVLHTPGHTPGSVCYLSGKTMFSGDTLFYRSYGRVDLPGGDPAAMAQSLQKLLALDAEIVAYPGHGMKTKIGWERGLFA